MSCTSLATTNAIIRTGGGVPRKPRERSEGERGEVLERVFGMMCEGMSVEECGPVVGVKAGTLRQWVLRSPPEVQKKYWEARRLWGSALAEQAVVIARESVNQTSTVDKLKIDTFLRLAGKANPVEYGEKQVVEHSGAQKLEIVVREEVKPVRAASVTAQLTEAGAAMLASAAHSIPALQGKSAVEEVVVEAVAEPEG